MKSLLAGLSNTQNRALDNSCISHSQCLQGRDNRYIQGCWPTAFPLRKKYISRAGTGSKNQSGNLLPWGKSCGLSSCKDDITKGVMVMYQVTVTTATDLMISVAIINNNNNIKHFINLFGCGL